MSKKSFVLNGAAGVKAVASILVLTTILCVSAFAGQIQGGHRRVFLFEEFQPEEVQSGEVQSGENQSLFLFSRGAIENHIGDLYIFGGDLSVSGDFSGEVYANFARLRLEPEGGTQKGDVHILSTRVYSSRSGAKILPLLGDLDPFMNIYSIPTGKVYDNSIPELWLKIFLSIGNIALCFILLPIKKSFFEQSGLSVINEPLRAVRNGIILYFTLLTSAFIFMISILGFPISVAIFLLLTSLCLVGYVSAGYALGYLCLKALNRETYRDTYSNVAVGVIMIQAFRLIPFMRWAIDFLILPILALGAIATGVINGFLKKKFFDAEGLGGNSGPIAPDDKIREIILGRF